MATDENFNQNFAMPLIFSSIDENTQGVNFNDITGKITLDFSRILPSSQGGAFGGQRGLQIFQPQKSLKMIVVQNTEVISTEFRATNEEYQNEAKRDEIAKKCENVQMTKVMNGVLLGTNVIGGTGQMLGVLKAKAATGTADDPEDCNSTAGTYVTTSRVWGGASATVDAVGEDLRVAVGLIDAYSRNDAYMQCFIDPSGEVFSVNDISIFLDARAWSQSQTAKTLLNSTTGERGPLVSAEFARHRTMVVPIVGLDTTWTKGSATVATVVANSRNFIYVFRKRIFSGTWGYDVNNKDWVYYVEDRVGTIIHPIINNSSKYKKPVARLYTTPI